MRNTKYLSGFTVVEALVAVTMFGLLMGGMFLANTNAANNIILGVREAGIAEKAYSVQSAVYRIAESATAIHVTPIINAQHPWNWGPFSGAASINSFGEIPSLDDVKTAHTYLASVRPALTDRELDPVVPFFDLKAITASSNYNNLGYMVWFETSGSVMGILTIEKQANSPVLTVSLATLQNRGASDATTLLGQDITKQPSESTTGRLFESYTVRYLADTLAPYRGSSSSVYPLDPASYALVHAVRQFDESYYTSIAGSGGHFSGTLILLPNPFDLDATAVSVRISLQSLCVENASPIFIYAHN